MSPFLTNSKIRDMERPRKNLNYWLRIKYGVYKKVKTEYQAEPENPVLKKSYEKLYRQIQSRLPGNHINPSDLEQTIEEQLTSD